VLNIQVVFASTVRPKAAAVAASMQAEPQMIPVRTIILFTHLVLFICSFCLFQGLFYSKNEIRMAEILRNCNCNFDMCPCVTQFQFIVKRKIIHAEFFYCFTSHASLFLSIMFIQYKKARCLMFMKQSDQHPGIKFHRWPVRVSCSILNPLKNEFKDSAHTAQ